QTENLRQEKDIFQYQSPTNYRQRKLIFSQIYKSENIKQNQFIIKGKELMKQGEFNQALLQFQEALINDPQLQEAQYLQAICYLQLEKFQKSIDLFSDLIEKQQDYRRNIYLLVAICYKKINQLNAAIQILNKGIQYYPKYYDAYVYHGKLQVKTKRYEKAIIDFEMAIQLKPFCGLGYIGKADCLRHLKKFNEAIEIYSFTIKLDQNICKIALQKRAVCYIEFKHFDQARNDLNSLLQSDPTNSEAFYFKGILLIKENKLNEALLSFEQAIKYNNSSKAIVKSLQEIAKIKIQFRDYYQAYYTLQRANYLDIDNKKLKILTIFTDGVTFLMKRKYKEGIHCLTELINKNTLNEFLHPLVYTHRAYGYFCSIYNKYICQSIISCAQNQFEKAIKLLNSANKISPKKMEPFFYKGMVFVKFGNKLINKNSHQKKLQYVQNAIKNFDKAIILNDQNANIYYYRAILNFFLIENNIVNDKINIYKQINDDLDKAIEKSQENISNHFYVRGLLNAYCNQVNSAISDLSIAITLDDTLSNAYLNRSKCFLLTGDKSSAFEDLQRYVDIKRKTIKKEDDSSDIHLWSGNLLFNIGAFEDAIKAYSNINGINKNEEYLLLRIKCYFAMKDLTSTIEDIDSLLQLNSNNKEISIDKICLESLKSFICQKNYQGQKEGIQQIKSITKQKSGFFFKWSDIVFYKAVFYFQTGNFIKAIKNFQKSIQIKGVECNNNNKLYEFDFDNQTYNIYEFYYSCAACFIMMKQYKQAIKQLQQLKEIIPNEGIIKQLDLIIQILYDEMQNSILKIFPYKNRFCSTFKSQQAQFQIYKYFVKQLKFYIYIQFQNIQKKIKLYFCLPYVEYPSIKPQFDNSLIENFKVYYYKHYLLNQFLKPELVENKPEAPWIRKCQDGFILTENIQYFDNLDLQTETKIDISIQIRIKKIILINFLDQVQKLETNIISNSQILDLNNDDINSQSQCNFFNYFFINNYICIEQNKVKYFSLQINKIQKRCLNQTKTQKKTKLNNLKKLMKSKFVNIQNNPFI
ncbi:hypothetical protein IMG5_070720, partial [Ichthyophthirius multifiliis]